MTTMPRLIPYFASALALIPALCHVSAAQISAQIAAHTATVVAGEPLLLDVSITNAEDKDLYLNQDWNWIKRGTVHPDGSVTTWTPPTRPADYAYPGVRLTPGEKRRLEVVASETAALRAPGDYEMKIEIAQLHLSSSIRFAVLPYDPSAIQHYAEHLVASLGPAVEEDITIIQALASLPNEIAVPSLCQALKKDSTLIFQAAPRLEDADDRNSAACFIELHRLYTLREEREAVESSLHHIGSRTRDPYIRAEIENALNP